MSHLKKISILLCGMSLGLGEIAFAQILYCEPTVVESITQAECATMLPSEHAKKFCKAGIYKPPVCVWSKGLTQAGQQVVGCWASCGG
jgi:hypothetical protein